MPASDPDSHKAPQPRRRRLVIGLAAVLALALLPMVALVWDGLTDDLHPADLGVVLGNTVHTDGTPSPRLRARLDRAVDLYREGLFPVVLVSGGVGREGFDEAEVMRDYLTAQGVPPDQVLTDSDGRNTFLTARSTARLMEERGMRSALVVSQYFHLPRCKLAFRQQGIEPVYSAHARYWEPRDLYSIPREALGLAAYRLRRRG